LPGMSTMPLIEMQTDVSPPAHKTLRDVVPAKTALRAASMLHAPVEPGTDIKPDALNDIRTC